MNTTRTLQTALLTLACAAGCLAASGGSANLPRQRALSKQGEVAENRGNFAAAAKAYRKSALYAADNRTRAGLALREAECRLQSGDPHEAFAAYKKLIESYPLYVPYDRVLPRLRQLAGDFAQGRGSWFGFHNRTKAIEVYEFILQEAPVGGGVIQDSMSLGDLLIAVGRPEEAIPVYRDALKRFPGDPQVPQLRLALGRLLVDASKTGDGDGQVARQAVRELDSFIKSKPDDSQRRAAEDLLALTRERRAANLYELGRFYLRPAHRRELAARRYLSDVIREAPGTAAASQAERLLASLGPAPQVPDTQAEAVAQSPAAVGEGSVVPPPPATAKVKKPARRLLEGLLPDGSPDEGQPRAFRTLEDRENVTKWLLPLGDVNELKSVGGTK